MAGEGGWSDCQEGRAGLFAHHPSKPLMFALGKRTPWPGLMSSYVTGNRIKSSHSSLKRRKRKKKRAVLWLSSKGSHVEGDDETLWCTLQGHDSRLRWMLTEWCKDSKRALKEDAAARWTENLSDSVKLWQLNLIRMRSSVPGMLPNQKLIPLLPHQTLKRAKNSKISGLTLVSHVQIWSCSSLKWF